MLGIALNEDDDDGSWCWASPWTCWASPWMNGGGDCHGVGGDDNEDDDDDDDDHDDADDDNIYGDVCLRVWILDEMVAF